MVPIDVMVVIDVMVMIIILFIVVMFIMVIVVFMVTRIGGCDKLPKSKFQILTTIILLYGQK